MADKSNSRRKLLKSIAAGSGAVVAGKSLPESWSKPVINSVMLPAHAETTDDTGSEGGDVTTTVAPTTTEAPCCLTEGVYCTKFGSEQSVSKGYIEIEISAAGSVQVRVYTGNEFRFEGTGSIPCTGGQFTITADYVSEAALNEGSNEIALAPNSLTVTGTVVCGQTTVSGTITGLQEPHNYTADPCMDR